MYVFQSLNIDINNNFPKIHDYSYKNKIFGISIEIPKEFFSFNSSENCFICDVRNNILLKRSISNKDKYIINYISKYSKKFNYIDIISEKNEKIHSINLNIGLVHKKRNKYHFFNKIYSENIIETFWYKNFKNNIINKLITKYINLLYLSQLFYYFYEPQFESEFFPYHYGNILEIHNKKVSFETKFVIEKNNKNKNIISTTTIFSPIKKLIFPKLKKYVFFNISAGICYFYSYNKLVEDYIVSGKFNFSRYKIFQLNKLLNDYNNFFVTNYFQ